MTPLAHKLAARIRADGPMTIADYMAACLGDPEHGYYIHREPFGVAGDFITAPEVSQMFGELIGLWCVALHREMGAPLSFCLAELGPGRGTLMADLLRVARRAPGFTSSAEIVLIETSPKLRVLQQEKLADESVTWLESVEALPEKPLIVIANEFFDALPIRQFQRAEDGWAERMVGLDEAGALTLGLRPGPPGASGDAPLGAVYEHSPVGTAVVSSLAARIASHGGGALVIDYGHLRPGFGDTLQAVRRHQFEPVLAAPGEADITAHVDFAALTRAAGTAGQLVAGVLTQRDFLMRLGIIERTARLSEGKDGATQKMLAEARDRLIGEEQMGTLFKVLALGQPGVALPAFDMA
jgi:NADH dehydrogenase [ubiquinone] 1 alpha subcomplex assembly factor 7